MENSVNGYPGDIPAGERQKVAGRARSWIVTAGPLAAALAMLLLGVALRRPVAWYDGPRLPTFFATHIVQYMGAYTDIAQLYFRDRLWRHPFPYFDYTFEYPVGMGMLVWLVGFVNDTVTSYFLATAAVLVVSGLVVVRIARSIEGANPWLIALAPALPLYVVLNWDMFGLVPTVAALALFHRRHDAWGAVALTAAIWTKFFPIVLVPIVLFDRLLRRQWRDVFLIGGIVGLGSVIVNAPFALRVTSSGVSIRESWLYFFRFNQERPPANYSANLWELLAVVGVHPTTQQINTASTLLMAAALGVVALLLYRAHARGLARAYDLVLPASVAMIGWFMFINKIYSPQYSLWIAVLIGLIAVPPYLAAIFGGADLLFFGAIWTMLYLSNMGDPASWWVYDQVVIPTTLIREAAILLIVGWALGRLIRPRRAAVRSAKLPT